MAESTGATAPGPSQPRLRKLKRDRSIDVRPVVHIMPAEPYGGLQGLAIELAREQRATGMSAEVVLLSGSERVEVRCRSAGITPIVLKGRKFLQMIALGNTLRRLNPIIVHSHCEPVWASLVLAAWKPAWIAHLHVYAAEKSSRDRLGNWIRRLRAGRFVAITHSVAESFVETGLIATERAGIVYNGIDLAAIPHSPGRADKRRAFTIAFVGRAVREKGLFDFIEVADLLRHEPDLQFVIAGEGGDLAEARAMIAARGLDERISVLGFVEDIGALLRDVDILLMLSIREPFGLVILEAIASGVAVLGYDTPSGGSEIMAVIPGCRMVPAFAIRELAAAICDALRNRALLSDQVAEGRAVIERRFTLKRMERNIAREYKRLAATPDSSTNQGL